ncbi:DinB family protein [Nocardiopsis sp. RSe5-2]|uniref:DinB family protein n=1 Tax=Nocardiopsis endophytica TaxID=3018445 RepID=A0ABT4U1R0_9ACTN|nr:DinB family protein [Nocardiopsis endophytica]MDA2810425.1 DinB family protein [Nocardiopsis endophytica]
MDALRRVMAAAPEGGEREVLEAFLDAYRLSVEEKAAGLSDEDARRRLVPSRTTMAGLLRHLALVERNWFGHVLQGIPAERLGIDLSDPDSTWADLRPGDTVASLTEEYRRACAESRAAAAGSSLDDAVPHAELGRVTLRWIYVHMIEETARHAGHADILREQTDGATGRFADAR